MFDVYKWSQYVIMYVSEKRVSGKVYRLIDDISFNFENSIVII